LIDLYDRGMREPLPLACMTSAAYAAAVFAGEDAGKAARDAWESGWNFPKEDAELEHQLVRGGILTFDELTAEPPRADEGWDATETTRFGRYALRLWEGLLDIEGVFER
jgi:exodeoxyribonuclease V gamma subunit